MSIDSTKMKDSINKDIDKTTDKTTEESINKNTDKVTDKPTNENTDKATDKAINENTDKATDKAINESTDKVTDKPTNESTNKATSKTTDKATDNPTDESISKATDTPTDTQTEKNIKSGTTPSSADKYRMEIIDYDIDDSLVVKDETKDLDSREKKKKEKEPINWKKEMLSWIKMLATAVILAFVITKFIIINANVPTESMENTIPAKSRIMGLRLTYLFSEPKRGDVVVFEFQFKDDVNYVKRIIGLPGETVYIKNGSIEIYKDGEYVETLEETYLKEEWTKANDGYTFVIPEGKYLVLGDNRNDSADARYWYTNYYLTSNNEDGIQCKYDDIFVDEDAILGKVYFTYWPHFSFVND